MPFNDVPPNSAEMKNISKFFSHISSQRLECRSRSFKVCLQLKYGNRRMKGNVTFKNKEQNGGMPAFETKVGLA